MSNRDDQDDLIKNQDTRTRRAWVERALQGARRRLDGDSGPPDAAVAPRARRPRLYVVPSGRKR